MVWIQPYLHVGSLWPGHSVPLTHISPLSFNKFEVIGIPPFLKVCAGCFSLAMIALHATSLCHIQCGRRACDRTSEKALMCTCLHTNPFKGSHSTQNSRLPEKAVSPSNLSLGKVTLHRIEKRSYVSLLHFQLYFLPEKVFALLCVALSTGHTVTSKSLQ